MLLFPKRKQEYIVGYITHKKPLIGTANSYFTQTFKNPLEVWRNKEFLSYKTFYCRISLFCTRTETHSLLSPTAAPVTFRSEDKQGALRLSLNYEELEIRFPFVTAECPVLWAIVNSEEFRHLWLTASLPDLSNLQKKTHSFVTGYWLMWAILQHCHQQMDLAALCSTVLFPRVCHMGRKNSD